MDSSLREHPFYEIALAEVREEIRKEVQAQVLRKLRWVFIRVVRLRFPILTTLAKEEVVRFQYQRLLRQLYI